MYLPSVATHDSVSDSVGYSMSESATHQVSERVSDGPTTFHNDYNRGVEDRKDQRTSRNTHTSHTRTMKDACTTPLDYAPIVALEAVLIVAVLTSQAWESFSKAMPRRKETATG
jgi:hypothetical protein